MKRMRKGIVVLVIAATGTIGIIGTGSNMQAGPVSTATVKAAEPMPQAMGSSWQ